MSYNLERKKGKWNERRRQGEEKERKRKENLME
jgi:hypothetical protein